MDSVFILVWLALVFVWLEMLSRRGDELIAADAIRAEFDRDDDTDDDEGNA